MSSHKMDKVESIRTFCAGAVVAVLAPCARPLYCDGTLESEG